MGIYIYIYYLIKYYRAGGYPPDQNSKNRYPSVIRIFKISVSVRIYASGRVSGSAGLIGRVGFHGFLPTPNHCVVRVILIPGPTLVDLGAIMTGPTVDDHVSPKLLIILNY